ncbi:MAG: GAF domain-containing protein [Armatimonadota bacterium]|nr:MAG: GAF domain-containing protein [Armatimonadota bacterium]
MQPSLKRRALLSLLIVASLPFITYIVSIDGGTAGSMVHFYYIPIVTAAIFLGDIAGMATAIAAAILTIFLPQARTGEMQPFHDIFVRLAFFYAVAILAARLSAQFQLRAQESSSLLSVSRAVNSSLRLHDVFRTIVEKAAELLEIKAASVLLLTPDGHHLIVEAAQGLSDEYLDKPPVPLTDGLIAEAVANRKPTIITEPTAHPWPEWEEYARREGITSVACVPIAMRDKLLGALCVYAGDRVQFSGRAIRILQAFADQAGIAIENARLYEDIRRNYWDTERSLTRAIEAKDPHTLGHSERVTEYALRMGNELRLPADEMDTIRFGTILHDVGKIGVAEHVLNNEHTLSPQDEILARLHPLIGNSILEPVDFLKPALDIVLHHHETLDGSGYPEGLAGDAIPRLARLVAVANAYDNLTSAAPDRPAIERSDALGELERLSGSLYDPEMVNALRAALEREH